MSNRRHSITSPGRTEAIVVAAGKGSRLGGDVVKSLRILGDRPLFAHSLTTFEQVARIDSVILVVSGDEIQTVRHWVKKLGFSKVAAVVSGGRERGDSVQEGLKAVSPDTEWIAIHDGARAFISCGLVDRVLDAAYAEGAAIPAVPVTDTIKEVVNSQIIKTVDRKNLRGAQTPQIFARQRLMEAYRQAAEEDFSSTDDADVVQRFTAGPMVIVEGEEVNFKITTRSDWRRAEDFCQRISIQEPATFALGDQRGEMPREGERP